MYHGLSVKLPMESPDHPERHDNEFTKCREALALLAAVETVDQVAWKYILQECCGVDIGREGEHKFEKVPARFRLEMDLQGRTSETRPDVEVFDLVHLCGVEQREQASEEYLEALQGIAEINGSQPGAGEDIEVPVAISVNFDIDFDEPLEHLLSVQKAEHEIKRQWENYRRESKEREVKPGSLRCTLVLEPMLLSLLLYNYELIPVAMERLMPANVWFTRLHGVPLQRVEELDEEDYDEREARRILSRLMGCIFSSTRHSVDHANMNYHFGASGQLQHDDVSIFMGLDPLEASHFEAVCSALVSAQTTRSVSLSSAEYPVDSNHWYKWLAYSVFSERARTSSSPKEFAFSVTGMAVEDVRGFSDILASEHPEELLCGRPRGTEVGRDATLKSGAPIRWDFDENGEPFLDSQALTCATAIDCVRTFSDDGRSDWVDAIVAGFGRCQVRRSDLTFVPKVVTLSEEKLISLSVEVALSKQVDLGGLPEFLVAVGPLLRSLKLASLTTEPDLNMVFRSCPYLEDLTLCGGLVDVQLDFRGARFQRSSNKTFTFVDWHDIPSLSGALIDSNNPVSKCVRRLHVRLTNASNRWRREFRGYRTCGFENDLRPLLEILEANRNLEFLEVHVRESSGYAKHTSKFREYHLEPIARVLRPLSIESKIAFLSVFTDQSEPNQSGQKKRYRNSSPGRAFRELNLETLSDIFAYAATPVLRQVYFSVKRKGHGWDDRPDEERPRWARRQVD